MASTPPQADYGKEAVLDISENNDVETGEVKNGGLQRDLKNRHMQMIAIGMASLPLHSFEPFANLYP
jgi:amino acid permease